MSGSRWEMMHAVMGYYLEREAPNLYPSTITIQHNVGTEDAAGHTIPDWRTFLVTPAMVEDQFTPLQANEKLKAEQIWAFARFKVRIPYAVGITSLMRILNSSNEIMQINSVNDHWVQGQVTQMICTKLPSN